MQRSHIADQRTPRGRADRSASALKERFRELDKDRNGMLDIDELALLLACDGSDKGLSRQEAETLMRGIDKDCSGFVSFAEFVDFIFFRGSDQPTESQSQVLLGSSLDREELEEDLLASSSKAGPLQNGFFVFGGTEEEKTGGIYRKPAGDLIIDSTVGHLGCQDSTRNGHPVFDMVSAQGLQRWLFYGCTFEGDIKGWFIAESLPTDGQPVEEYLVCNPSPLASTPDYCCATWQTPDGRRPKRFFVERLPQVKPRKAKKYTVTHCKDSELWAEELREHDPDLDHPDGQEQEDFDWEAEWTVEAGEFDFESDDEPTNPRGSLDGAAEIAEEILGIDKEKEEEKPKLGAPSTQLHKKTKQRRRARHTIAAEATSQTHTVAPGFKVVRRATPGPGANAESSSAAGGTSKAKAKANAKSKEREKSDEAAKKEKHQKEHDDWSKYVDGKFLDQDFPPSKTSLGEVGFSIDGWMRLSQMHDNPCLTRSIVPDNVIANNSAGNLWFLSACATAAEYPAWISSMFGRTTMLTQSGKYTVRMYHPGRKEFLRITVDDYVPVRKGAPAFTGITGDGEIWAALVEKAFAKMCKSYAHTQWGANMYGLLYVCGGGLAESWSRGEDSAPRESTWQLSNTEWHGLQEVHINREIAEGTIKNDRHRNANQLWQMLRTYMEFCYPVSCDVDSSNSENSGLLVDRSYSLLGARELPAKGGRHLRIVFLRNPSGIHEWQGRWSNDSDTWDKNPAARDELCVTSRPGTFWMSYTKFLKHFARISIVRKTMPVQGCNPTKLHGLKRGLGFVMS